MPELPDVQVFRDRVDPEALNRRIETVSVRADGMLDDTSEGSLRSALKGHALDATERRGKHLFLRSGEPRGRWLHLHFGMTGYLTLWDGDGDEPSATRLRLDFEDGGHLAFPCRRKLGRIGLVESPDAAAREKELGPDPLRDGFGLRDFRERLEGRSGALKGTLTNQSVIAGVGNLYADETLFQADLHPQSDTDALDDEEVGTLWRRLKRVLEKAIEYRVDADRMPSTWLLPNREEGADCPRCGGTLRRTEVGGRTTIFCDRHQERVERSGAAGRSGGGS